MRPGGKIRKFSAKDASELFGSAAHQLAAPQQKTCIDKVRDQFIAPQKPGDSWT